MASDHKHTHTHTHMYLDVCRCWCVSAPVGCFEGALKFYDSNYMDVDCAALAKIIQLYQIHLCMAVLSMYVCT